MKHGQFILAASIAAALAAAPALAQPAANSSIHNPDAPRVTQTINNNVVSLLPKTHLHFVRPQALVKPLADSFKMNHLQLILKPSMARQAALASLIADQHNPKSSRFHQWLTPTEFGDKYGVADQDIAAVTSWLKSQGFQVNNVYPNKTQIDFSGTSAQIRAAFHTQEGLYAFGKNKHIANASDISVPAALKDVVTGVMGLNDFRPKAMHTPLKGAHFDKATKGLVLNAAKAGNAVAGHKTGGKGMAVNLPYSGYNPQGQIRALVPNDLATMYGVRTLRNNGVTGKGINIAVVDIGNMVPADWTNFVQTFNLGQYNGTFTQFNPAAPSGPNNCYDSGPGDDGETLLDAEWSTAMAPGANIWVATCSGGNQAGTAATTSNFFGGVYIAANNLINATDPSQRPDIISASYGFGEQFTDAASKSAIDLMWAQADAEGISVFVSTGDSGSNPSFNGGLINGYYGNTAVDANSFATSPNVTGVGGTDLADIIDGTTSKYFAANPSVVGGSALSYVPEIPWNESCGNGVAAKSMGYNHVIGFCNDALRYSQNPPATATDLQYYQNTWQTSEAGSGGPSSYDRKPAWQRQVYNAAPDQSRDLPDVSLFAGSFGDDTFIAVCSSNYVCTPDFTDGGANSGVGLSGGTSLASPMFAGIQALIDEGLTRNGLPADQGNAAPTLYALAANEYGNAAAPGANLATCNSDNGATGTNGCVFHNITRGSISTACYSETASVGDVYNSFTTPNCYYYNSFVIGTSGDDTLTVNIGLTTSDVAPTSYTVSNKAFSAQPGWSFAAGLGSVNATNLLMAWRKFVNAPPIQAPQ